MLKSCGQRLPVHPAELYTMPFCFCRYLERGLRNVENSVTAQLQHATQNLVANIENIRPKCLNRADRGSRCIPPSSTRCRFAFLDILKRGSGMSKIVSQHNCSMQHKTQWRTLKISDLNAKIVRTAAPGASRRALHDAVLLFSIS